MGVRILHIHSFFLKCFYSCIEMAQNFRGGVSDFRRENKVVRKFATPKLVFLLPFVHFGSKFECLYDNSHDWLHH